MYLWLLQICLCVNVRVESDADAAHYRLSEPTFTLSEWL